MGIAITNTHHCASLIKGLLFADVPQCFCVQITLPAVDEKKKVIEDVDKDRKYAIDAAIVRTMKSRKVLGHQHVRPAPLYPDSDVTLTVPYSSFQLLTSTVALYVIL